MDSAIYWASALLLTLANCGALFSTLLTMPGNWFIVAASAIFAAAFPATDGRGISWAVVLIIVVLAGIGEVIEMAAGAAGAAKQGASRRAMLLSVGGAMMGSMIGAVLGSAVPVPILGTVGGALVGGAGGAFLGAYCGEWWKGRGDESRITVGKAAMVGRVYGTVGKMAIGAVMVAIVTVDLFL